MAFSTMPLRRAFVRRSALTGTVLLSALVLTACGAGGSDGPVSTPAGSGSASSTASYGPVASGPHTAVDVRFATGMIPHHAQAVEMAILAGTQATNPAVQQLATAIKGAQASEISAMKGWLAGWGEKIPNGSPEAMSGTDGSGMHSSMNGMMSGDQMQQLSKARGATFDRLWVKQMTEHHLGAVQMAKIELSQGANPDAQALATKIIKTQSAELAQLTALAKSLPA